MKISIIAVLVALGTALSGCATIVQGSTQTVSVNTTPGDGAKCDLTNSEGVWYITTPGSAMVHKTKNDLTILCKKDGFTDAKQVVAAKFGGTRAGNVLAGGLIGIAVDAASGEKLLL